MTLALLAGLIRQSWVLGVTGFEVTLIVLYPMHLGCGLGALGAIRRVNRTARVPHPTGWIWAGIVAPLPLIVVANIVSASLIFGAPWTWR